MTVFFSEGSHFSDSTYSLINVFPQTKGRQRTRRTGSIGSCCYSKGRMRVKVKVAQSCLTLCNPVDYTVHGILQARILEWVAFPSSRGSSQPRIEPRSPALQVDSLPAEPPGKPKNTRVGSLSLLQRIFLIQGSNPGLPHCRQVLYQLSHRASQKGRRPSCISGVLTFSLFL